jgi:hypothetical protein
MAKNQDIETAKPLRDKGPIFVQPGPLGQVPRIVHQIWVQGGPTGEAAGWIEGVMALCVAAGWKHVLWSGDKDGVRWVDAEGLQGELEMSPQMKGMLELCRCFWTITDVIRLFVLRQFGGLYLDADIEAYALPEGLEGAWISCQAKKGSMLNNCAMAAPPWHPYIHRQIDWFASTQGMEKLASLQPVGNLTAQVNLGPDVTVWEMSQWNSKCRVFGNHWSRFRQWGSDKERV